MEKLETLLEVRKRHLIKALERLTSSYERIKNLPLPTDKLDDHTLEMWESFSARFSRASDLFLSQYLRTFVLLSDKGFQGSMRDFLNTGEKLGIIDDAEAWMNIRELRNISAYLYVEDELPDISFRFLESTPKVLKLKEFI